MTDIEHRLIFLGAYVVTKEQDTCYINELADLFYSPNTLKELFIFINNSILKTYKEYVKYSKKPNLKGARNDTFGDHLIKYGGFKGREVADKLDVSPDVYDYNFGVYVYHTNIKTPYIQVQIKYRAKIRHGRLTGFLKPLYLSTKSDRHNRREYKRLLKMFKRDKEHFGIKGLNKCLRVL